MRQALEMALEALETAWYHVGTFQPTEKAIDLYDEARTAIKEALAQPEQPKVRTGDCLLVGVCASEGHKIQAEQEPWRESASDYERGVIDGRQMQAQSSVDKAVNRMAQPDQDEVDIRSRLYQRIHELETQLAQPEQKPVAYINIEERKLEWAYKYMSWDTPTVINLPKIPLYTEPPQRTWVGLTDEEIYEATKDVDKKPLRVIVDLLEAKLKEKNT